MIRVLAALILGGVAGEIVFEVYAWVISPMIFGVPLEPAKLIQTLAQRHLTMLLDTMTAFIAHVWAGIVVFPIGYWLFSSLLPIRSVVIAGVLWGVLLWAFAQGFLAPMAGRPMFMDFTPFTWSSLVGHVVYAVIVAVVFGAARPRTQTA